MKPGSGRIQSANVRIGTLRLNAIGARRTRRRPLRPRASVSKRSIVAALTPSNLVRAAGSTTR